MNVFVSAGLEQHAHKFGIEGTQWLNGLPKRLETLEQTWGFRAGPAFEHGGSASWVAPVEFRDGSEAVLKISIPHEEARFESHALRFLDGRAAVRLLRASDDGFSLLLERCLPGTDLWTLTDADADAVAIMILPRLWREPVPHTPFVSVTDVVAYWWERLPRMDGAADYAPELVAHAIARGQELVASQPRSVLLHGDFHPGNVLAAGREPWLIIDPKPLVGEPAYDLAQWLYNRQRTAIQSADLVSILRQQIDCFAENLGLNPARIAGWALVKALGWDCGSEVVTLFQEVAKAW